VFTVGNAMLRQKTYDNYPAQRAIMSAVTKASWSTSTRR
jgi:hypothetical protein